MDKEERLRTLREAWRLCQACPLSKNRRQIVFGGGSTSPKIVVVASAPKREEDRGGGILLSPQGNLLLRLLASASPRADVKTAYDDYLEQMERATTAKEWDATEEALDRLGQILFEDLYLLYAVMCVPLRPSPLPNRPMEVCEPAPEEIKACRARLLEQLYVLDPAVIVTSGGSALHAVVGKKLGISTERGRFREVSIPGRTQPVVYPLMPIQDPGYLLQKNDFGIRGGEVDKAYKSLVAAFEIAYATETKNLSLPTVRYKGATDTWHTNP